MILFLPLYLISLCLSIYVSLNPKITFSFFLQTLPCFLVISDDPEVPHVQHHRKFLKEHVVFKEVYFVILLLFSILERSNVVDKSEEC